MLKRILILIIFSATAASAAGPVAPATSTAPVSVGLSAGYRFVSTDDNPQRVGKYDYLHSSATATGEVKGLYSSHRFLLEGSYLNEKDYLLEGDYDYRGLFRIYGMTEALYHNLDHRPNAPPDRPDATRPSRPTSPWIHFQDMNSGETYSREINQSEVRLRGKLPDYPAHLNLEYWRFTREGSQQQHFLDEGAGTSPNSCVQCHVRSKTRKLDRVTDQFRVGSNAHFGPVDVSLTYQLRDFREKEEVPRDSFGSLYSNRTGTDYRNIGNYQHDEAPDSRLQSGELKVHSSLSGGLVAAGNFSIGKRENRSDVSDVYPVKAESDFYKGGTDLTWQPNPRWTIHFRYRLLDIDNSNSSQISAVGSPQVSDLEVRNSIDLTRDTYTANLVYRPVKAWKLRLDAGLVQLHRGNTGTPTHDPLNPAWELPKDENIYSAGLDLASAFTGKNLPRLQARYRYEHSDDPAYGSSAEDQHEFFGSAKWQFLETAGFFGNARYLHAENNRYRLVQGDGTDFYNYELDHRQDLINATTGIWSNPADGTSLSFFYGYIHNKVEQDVLFGTDPSSDPAAQVNVLDEDAPYRHRVHSLNVVGSIYLRDDLTATFEGRFVDSKGSFEPDFDSFTAPYFGFGDPTVTSAGIEELSEIKMRQYGARFGLEWKGRNNWIYGAQYALEEYDDRLDDRLDGRTQVLLVNVGRRW